jgi:hypothetical protein
MPVPEEIHAELPEEFRQFFRLEVEAVGHGALQEYSTPRQRHKKRPGGFGFGYNNIVGNGQVFFVERWFASNPDQNSLASWEKLAAFAEENNWEIFGNEGGTTSILLNLGDLENGDIVDSIINFLNTISQLETGLTFLEAATNELY